jgi:hypothetical protein
MRRKNMLPGNSGRLATATCDLPDSMHRMYSSKKPTPKYENFGLLFFYIKESFLSMRLRDCKTRLFLFFSLVWSWYSPFDFRVSLWGSLLRHSDKHWLASHIVRAPNSRSGGHEFKSPMRQELGALTKRGKTLGVMCRASMHSFHRLSILERATDHECNNNCNRPSDMWVGFKCNGLIIFLREEVLQKYTTHVFPPSPPSPSPPTCPTSSPWFPLPSSPTPPAPLLLGGTSLALVLWQGCSLKRRVIRKLWQSCCHIWWVRAVGEFGRSTGVRRWPAATPPLPRLSWCPWLGTWRQGRRGG